MGLIDKIQGGSDDEETAEYQCLTCHTTFESTQLDATDVTCQDCGSPNIRAA